MASGGQVFDMLFTIAERDEAKYVILYNSYCFGFQVPLFLTTTVYLLMAYFMYIFCVLAHVLVQIRDILQCTRTLYLTSCQRLRAISQFLRGFHVI